MVKYSHSFGNIFIEMEMKIKKPYSTTLFQKQLGTKQLSYTI